MATITPKTSINFNLSLSNPVYKLVPHATILIIACATIFFLSLAGNIVICYLLRNGRREFISFNFYILNLAVADIIITLTIPFEAVYFVLNHSFLLGDFMCKSLPFLRATAVHASSILLVIISYERYRAVLTSFRYSSKFKPAVFIISFAWFCGIVSSVVNLINNRVGSYLKKENLCLDYTPTRDSQANVLIIFIIFFACPLIILSVYHTLIIINLSRLVKVQLFKHSNATKTKSRVTLVVVLITISYFICYAPQYIIHIILRFNSKAATSQSFGIAITVTYWLAYSHSIWNPVIYGLTSSRMRKKFYRLYRS
ncbi:Galanin receptor type 2 [Trichoplax sp. H2]|nr:Galanin receptor type 2 [Trichoplax sp. H2]|eukprot:RDD43211.1 Galanin receptor type 2 [Trichoplax sp. H2]